jgi:hypothetical protein
MPPPGLRRSAGPLTDSLPRLYSLPLDPIADFVCVDAIEGVQKERTRQQTDGDATRFRLSLESLALGSRHRHPLLRSQRFTHRWPPYLLLPLPSQGSIYVAVLGSGQ